MDNFERTLMGFRCNDCADIAKVDRAGSIVRLGRRDVQIMHNGLKVVAGGYYGDWMAHLIRGLRGHHEPQEEALFNAAVRYARHNSLIVEVGAFWSYYALWYLAEVPGSKAICVEPDPSNLGVGRLNAKLNGLESRVSFVNAAIGGDYSAASPFMAENAGRITLPCLDMPSLHALAAGRTIEILHIDIQGAETALLRSLPRVAGLSVRFVFASTHHSSISGSTTTHQDCIEALQAAGAFILAEHSVQESFSGDGLIVASFLAPDRTIEWPEISRNTAERSLFPIP